MPTPKPTIAPSYESCGARPAAHIEAQLAGLVRAVANAPQGQRNAVLFWAASRAAEVIAQGQLSKPHAEAVLITAATMAGLENTEAARTIASALTRRAA
ncbi:MAG TPA: hypothetical protein PLO16_14695 [Acidocella sp.]|nr:hypothetical protein [Acidocella sp.]